MEKLDVRIVTLPPMRVVCFNGFGKNPENQAWGKLLSWARENNLLEKPRRFFGYNNPDPSPGSPNYGYDAWITVDESTSAPEDARLIDFPGGLYAVSRVHAGPNGESIFDTWQALASWVEKSTYRQEFHHRLWLEESLTMLTPTPDGSFTLDLFAPIRA